MKFGTCMLNRGHIVATIMNSKVKYLRQPFVTSKECNIVIALLREKFTKEKLNVCILDSIDKDYFKIMNEVIVLNEENNISIGDIKKIYSCNIPSKKIQDVIWDESLIYSYLVDLKDNKEILDFEISDLDQIITKVIDNTSEFYERVAKELSVEEYNFIASHLLLDHSCKNCKSICSVEDALQCKKWSPDELVGKAKVLKKY